MIRPLTTTVNFREGYRMFVSKDILLHHESLVRGEAIVIGKISRKTKLEDCLCLGNREAKCDGGHTRECLEGKHKIVQEPDDLVLANGESRSVREFAETAFSKTIHLIGHASKAHQKLGWKPRFAHLVSEMACDLKDAGGE